MVCLGNGFVSCTHVFIVYVDVCWSMFVRLPSSKLSCVWCGAAQILAFDLVTCKPSSRMPSFSTNSFCVIRGEGGCCNYFVSLYSVRYVELLELFGST